MCIAYYGIKEINFMQYIMGLKGPYDLNPKGICRLLLREVSYKSYQNRWTKKDKRKT